MLQECKILVILLYLYSERETVKSGTGQVQWCMLHQKLLKVADYIMANTMARSVLVQGMMNIKCSNVWEFNKQSSNFRE